MAGCTGATSRDLGYIGKARNYLQQPSCPCVRLGSCAVSTVTENASVSHITHFQPSAPSNHPMYIQPIITNSI